MKVVILAGGMGTRLSEETDFRPKPMVEIGGKPILWHIMKIYSFYGFNDFVLLLGYKSYVIKEYFLNYFIHQSDLTVDLKNNSLKIHNNQTEPWQVTLLDTGLHTQTASRIKKAREHLGDRFFLTYGDGVSDININRLLDFHKAHNATITMTSVQPEGRFGSLDVSDDGRVTSFLEKPRGDGSWINGGFFVCDKSVLDYIGDGDDVVWEREPLESLTRDGRLYTCKHEGFWKCMDTLRDKDQLTSMWERGEAKWKVW